MKTKPSILLLFFTLFFFNSCDCSKCEKKLQDFSCRYDELSIDKENLLLKTKLEVNIDFSNKSDYQPFQVDFLNSYMLLGKIIETDSNKIKKVEFKLFEAGGCKRYKIDNVKWEKADPAMCKGKTHRLKFLINKYPKESSGIPYNPEVKLIVEGGLDFEEANLTKIVIDSDEIDEIEIKECNPIVRFGPIDCPIKVTNIN